MALAPVFVERPARDDAALTLLGQPVDAGGDAREHRVAAAVAVERVGAGAVDHGPHDLGPHVLRNPRRRDELVVAAGHEPCVDLEAVSLGARAADEALVEDGSPEAAQRAGGSRGLGEGRRRRRRDAGIAGARLGNERLAVEQQRPVAVLHDVEWPLERWWQPERHLDAAAVVQAQLLGGLSEQPAGVAAVGRGAWPTEPAGDGERCEHEGRVEFMPCSQKHGGFR